MSKPFDVVREEVRAMAQPLRSLAAHSTEDLRKLLTGDQQSLRDLAPYNGTAPGARAIAETRRHMELVEAELARREGN